MEFSTWRKIKVIETNALCESILNGLLVKIISYRTKISFPSHKKLRLRLDVGIGAEELHWASNAKTGWKWKYSSMPMLLFG